MSNLPEDMRERALATLRTRCHRPNCKTKHRAKTEDTINAIMALLEEVKHAEHFNTHCVTCGKYNQIDRPEDEDICQCE